LQPRLCDGILQGNYCVNCGAPFLHSFVTFEALPLVEFELEPGISDAEAQALFGEDTSPHDEMGMRCCGLA
jgi:hypothetical protein